MVGTLVGTTQLVGTTKGSNIMGLVLLILVLLLIFGAFGGTYYGHWGPGIGWGGGGIGLVLLILVIVLLFGGGNWRGF
jgi:hypothetical protein